MQQLVFSVSTFADAHCKSPNLLLSWRTYMNCVHSELKFLVTGSSEISSALIRTHGTYLRFSLALIRTHTTGAKPPKTGPHSCRTHVFSSLSCKSHSSALMAALWRFRCTHPHSSARSLRLCIHASSTLASERMLSRNLCAAWMCFSMPSLPYHHPNRWFSYMSQNNIKPLFFFWKIILSQKIC